MLPHSSGSRQCSEMGGRLVYDIQRWQVYGHEHQKSPKAPTDTFVHASCPIVIPGNYSDRRKNSTPWSDLNWFSDLVTSCSWHPEARWLQGLYLEAASLPVSGRWLCQAHVHDSGQANLEICEPGLGLVHEGWRTCTGTTSTVRGQSNSEEGTASGIKLCGPGNDWVANTGLEKTTFEVSPAVETDAWSWATSSAGTAANLCFCTRQAVLA